MLLLLIGMVLSFMSDLLGSYSKNPEATSQVLMLPQLIFGLLSVGIQPVEMFPDWIEPVVRNQPISQFIYAMRALSGDSTPTAECDMVAPRPVGGMADRRDDRHGAVVVDPSGEEAVMTLIEQDAQA